MNSQILLLGIFSSLLSAGSLTSAQTNDPTILQNPCHGRSNGFARDLNSCNHYYYCQNGNSVRGVCPNNQLFDAEREVCANPQNARCFQCPRTNSYQLMSVPNACPQFVRCFNGTPTLHLCPQGLVFDGRENIGQCNFGPSDGSCYRETNTNLESPQRCPSIADRPVFLADSNNCSVYYVCSGNVTPQRMECANRLHFNVHLGVCDLPQHAQCQTNQPAGPAVPCRKEGEFIPHNQDCSLYYICVQGQPVQSNCANGLIFDHISRRCTLRSNGTCWVNAQK